ncbi:MAG: NUDIX hydrolase [Tractidigestivibacter sp.]|jgi:8-oxo-dGTP pyrophosphatase MutT (NUDIX family)|uniref:NUDIX hydrolase n=1 Tax=Tractidigestivibacter sp. TaxID=2847320 RepID=UPI003D8CC8DD
MDDSNLMWHVASSRQLIKDRWFDLREVHYQMPGGTKNPWPYYTFSKRSYVVIAAIDTDGNYLCVRQFRPGIGEVTLEMPAGGIEGDSKRPAEEAALAAARRELREETGYEADQWTHLLTIPSWATLSDDLAYLYLAQGCRRVGSQELDETEALSVETHSPSEMRELARAGKLQQVVHVAALYLAEEALGR